MKKIATVIFALVSALAALKADAPVVSGPGFTMSPNPVTGTVFFVNLDFSQTEYPNSVLHITNVLGQVVFSYTLKPIDFENHQIRSDVSDAKLDKGVYFGQLKSGEYRKTQKLAIR